MYLNFNFAAFTKGRFEILNNSQQPKHHKTNQYDLMVYNQLKIMNYQMYIKLY